MMLGSIKGRSFSMVGVYIMDKKQERKNKEDLNEHYWEQWIEFKI